MLMMAAVLNPQAAPPPPSSTTSTTTSKVLHSFPGGNVSDHLTPQLKAEIDPQTLLDIYVSIVPVDGEESRLESIGKSMTNQTRINIRNSN